MGHIVWLASYPKSGNTWLRAFLRSLLDPTGAVDINHLINAFPYDIGARFYRHLDARPVTELTRAETLALRPRVQRMIAEAGPDVAFVKTHSAQVVEDGFPLIDPEVTGGAVYLVRNPLDVAVSFSFHGSLSIDQTIDVINRPRAMFPANQDAASEYLGSWSENVESWTHPEDTSVHVVQYEHLVESPRRSFAAIVRHLGIPASREHLERAIKRSSFRVLREQERRGGFVEKGVSASAPFFRAGRVAQWRSVLTPKQVDRVVGAHGALMERFGYLP